jgi:hypothetical protein
VLVLEGAVGAVVDVDGSVRGKAVEEPELAVSDGDGGGEEARCRWVLLLWGERTQGPGAGGTCFEGAS